MARRENNLFLTFETFQMICIQGGLWSEIMSTCQSQFSP